MGSGFPKVNTLNAESCDSCDVKVNTLKVALKGLPQVPNYCKIGLNGANADLEGVWESEHFECG